MVLDDFCDKSSVLNIFPNTLFTDKKKNTANMRATNLNPHLLSSIYEFTPFF